ncbi:MAG TPA: VOC family protein, partial [Jiangellales bacterium]|nr:VOC family protein [Jiangellales bacterium]
LVVDARDPAAQAAWWASIVGGSTEAGDGGVSLVGADGFPWDYWAFQAVPEPKVVKNRVHWDVDLRGDDPADVVRAGATVLREPGGDISWWVLADPEGNEFCAFPPRREA